MTLLREGFDYAFSRLDPMGAHIDPPSVAVYDTLLVKGLDRKAHPGLATVVERSASGLEWTLRIRDGARFHTGAPCGAREVVDSLEALRWHVPGDPQLWYWDPVDDVVAVDDRTVRFVLHHPYRRFGSLLWGTHTAIYNRALQLARPDDFGITICDGTGPFQVESAGPDRVVATRFEAYPGPASVAAGVERIEWISIVDPGDRLRALLAGELDCLHGVEPGEVPGLRADPRFAVYEAPQASSMYLSLNWTRTDLGFDDRRLRRAVSAAIDRAALVRSALGGQGSPTWGPLPPGTEFYDPEVDSAGRHDLAGAMRELDALGWVSGEDGIRSRGGRKLSFECVVQRDPVFERVAGMVAEQLRAAGLELDIRPVKPFADFYEACGAGPASSISKWLWPDPTDALIGFASSSTAPFPNWSQASIPQLDKLFEQWLQAASDEELTEASRQIQQTFARELPYLPLLAPNDVWVWRAEVQGYTPSPDILYPLYGNVSMTGP